MGSMGFGIDETVIEAGAAALGNNLGESESLIVTCLFPLPNHATPGD